MYDSNIIRLSDVAHDEVVSSLTSGCLCLFLFYFFFNDTATTEIYTE